MIKYNLICDKEHEFESWFSNSYEFENLKKKKLLECIYCSSKKIEKSIMSPMISNSINLDTYQSKFEKDLFKEKKKLLQIREILVKKLEKFTTIKIVKRQYTAQQLLKRERN